MDLIRKHLAISDANKWNQRLTLTPQACSQNILQSFFGVSEYLLLKVQTTTAILGDVTAIKVKF